MRELSFSVLVQIMPLWSLSLFSFAALTLKVLNQNREPQPVVVLGIHFLSIFTSFALFFLVGFQELNPVVFSLHFDVFESGACAMAALAALLCLPLFARNTLLDQSQLTEILFLFSHALLGVYIFSLSQDLMTAFIGMELTALSFYLLIGMAPKEKLPLEASIKYFVLSSFAGIVFLYGLSFIFGLSGDVTVGGLATTSRQVHRFFFLGVCFLMAGLLFKMSVFPFQFWLPDVYQGAITPMTSFMATGFKAAVILFTGRVFLPVFSGEKLEVLLMGFAVLSVLTALFGNILALRQGNLKRLVAFSSLGHSGYLLMALTGLFTIQKPDFFPLFYYLSAYVFMTGGAFAVIQCLEEKTSQPTLKDLEGLFKTNPLTALSLTVFLLGLAGIPPVFGFFAKVALFRPVIEAGLWWMLFWGLVASGIGLYYYVKPIVCMCQGERLEPVASSLSMKALLAFAVTGSLLGSFFLGWF